MKVRGDSWIHLYKGGGEHFQELKVKHNTAESELLRYKELSLVDLQMFPMVTISLNRNFRGSPLQLQALFLVTQAYFALLYFAFLHFTDTGVFFVCLFVNILKVCGNTASGKSLGSIFPMAFAYFMSLCHILGILVTF